MRVFISEADKQNAKRVALANIAKFYDLRNWQSYNNDKLLEMVLEIPDMPTNFKNYLPTGLLFDEEFHKPVP